MFDSIVRDLRHAVRRLAASRTYSLVTVATLALVIGAGGALLAVINATLIRPLPFVEPDRLVRLYTLPPGINEPLPQLINPLHSLDFVRFRQRLRQVDAVEAFWARTRAVGDAANGTPPESVPAAQVSAGTLTVLGGAPLLGRVFSEEEDRAGAKVAVLSWGLWQRRFGGKPAIVGQVIAIDREPYEVIGVMPRDFEPMYVASQMWTPLGFHDGNMPLPTATFVQTVARLRPGATVAQLDGEVRSQMAEIIREAPTTHRGWTAGVMSMRDFVFGPRRPALFMLLAGVMLLALIACANLANLTLAEVMGRRHELVLRAALGSGRRDAIRLQLVESLILASSGAAGGLILAWSTLPALLALDPSVALQLADVSIDWRVQAGTAVLATGVALIAGLWPVWRITHDDLAKSLADGSRRTAGSRRDRWVQSLLVGSQVALTVVLLVTGAMLVRSFDRTARTEPGFDPHGVLGGQILLPPAANATSAERAFFVQRVLERIRSVPGVVAASTTANFFIPGNSLITLVDIDGRPSPDGQSYTVQFRRVSVDYFKTMRIRERAGRTFTDLDGPQSMQVAVVSESFAKRFWPDADPIGQRVKRGNVLLTVIGVVDDVRDVDLRQPGEPQIYIHYPQSNNQTAPISLVVRTAGDALALAPAVRAAVFAVDPAQPIDHILTLEQFLNDSLGPDRFRTTLLIVFALLALTLAAVGVYGVTARSAAERTREMGVRLALGAEPTGIWWLVIRRGMTAVVLGVLSGAVLAALAGMAVTRWLSGIQSDEYWTALPVAGAMAIAAFLACAVPARRIVRVDPVTVLRE